MTTNLIALKSQTQRPRMRRAAAMRCAICGCTDNFACDGGCSWSARGLCSTCVQVATATLDYIVSLAPPAHTREPLRRAATVLKEMFDGDTP